ncbi:MAG TPA: hydrogenase maturation protease [Pseudobacteroides sp.]|uniref:hydrogenase maturation protease n=1 Tax=Pseudobacteroides sp. TaxID=1968840 RepID=UPI002F92CCC8
MKEILVLGIGNLLMMDDGIGVNVVETLKKRNTNPGIRYVIGETDIYFCLNHIQKASYTVIVDAACLDKEPGAIRAIPLGQVFKNPIRPISAHDFHLFSQIEMTDKIIEGLFIGVEPYKIDYSFGLSAILQEQYFKIVERIENIITSCIR